MALKTTPWDSAEYLKTEADITAYLDACFEEAGDDPAFLVHALGVAARARNMSQLARDTGLTREGLYKALSSSGNPSFGTVLKVVDAMGYRFALVSKRLGFNASREQWPWLDCSRCVPPAPPKKSCRMKWCAAFIWVKISASSSASLKLA